MIALALGAGCFILMVLSHAAGARLNLVSARPAVGLGLGLLWLFALALAFHLVPQATWRLTTAAIYVLCCSAYANELIFISDKGPSMETLRLMDKNPRGLTLDELVSRFPDEYWIKARMDYLAQEGFVSREDEYFVLQPKSLLILRVLGTYRWLVGRGLGG